MRSFTRWDNNHLSNIHYYCESLLASMNKRCLLILYIADDYDDDDDDVYDDENDIAK